MGGNKQVEVWLSTTCCWEGVVHTLDKSWKNEHQNDDDDDVSLYEDNIK